MSNSTTSTANGTKRTELGFYALVAALSIHLTVLIASTIGLAIMALRHESGTLRSSLAVVTYGFLTAWCCFWVISLSAHLVRKIINEAKNSPN